VRIHGRKYGSAAKKSPSPDSTLDSPIGLSLENEAGHSARSARKPLAFKGFKAGIGVVGTAFTAGLTELEVG
jgi:hypothetical protein